MTKDVWLARKIEAWYRSCYNAAWAARGNPDSILESMPSDLIITLARNNIHLVYQGRDKEVDQ